MVAFNPVALRGCGGKLRGRARQVMEERVRGWKWARELAVGELAVVVGCEIRRRGECGDWDSRDRWDGYGWRHEQGAAVTARGSGFAGRERFRLRVARSA